MPQHTPQKEHTKPSIKEPSSNSPSAEKGSIQFKDNRPETQSLIQLQQTANDYTIKQQFGTAQAHGKELANTVVQRRLFKHRRGDFEGKWYTDYDPTVKFDTKEEAREHQRTFTDRHIEEKRALRETEKEEKLKKKSKKFKEEHPNYKRPVNSKMARVYKNRDKDFDELTITKLDASNAKHFMEIQIKLRNIGEFETQVINLGGYHHIIAPGTDIGLTATMDRPDLFKKDDFLALSRQGNPKTYRVLAKQLDAIAAKYAKKLNQDIDVIRTRMGKDLDRMTRGGTPDDTIEYDSDELAALNEIAAVLRLDKGRVPKATKYIRKTMTEGDKTYNDLFVKGKYEGAKKRQEHGVGGVQALRNVPKKDGDEHSEGSDMEEDLEVASPMILNSLSSSSEYSSSEEEAPPPPRRGKKWDLRKTKVKKEARGTGAKLKSRKRSERGTSPVRKITRTSSRLSLVASDEMKSKPGHKKRIKKKTRAMDERDIVNFKGHRFAPNVRGVRDLGQCFWDSLRRKGEQVKHLKAASEATGIEFNKHVNIQDIIRFLKALAEAGGSSYSIQMVNINIITMKPTSVTPYGEGDDTIFMGLFYQERDEDEFDDREGRKGHYVPELG